MPLRNFHKINELLNETLGNPSPPRRKPVNSMTSPAFPLPTVHLNGTSRQMLLDDYRAAYEKLIEFRDAFRSIEFNARDYYVHSNTAFSEARTERDIMEHKIGSLMQYLEAHLLHLAP